MVLTRNQIQNLTREELIEKLLKLSDISDQLKALKDRFNTFTAKYEELKSDMSITKNCNTLLYLRIIQQELHPVNNTQCRRREY